MPTPFGDTTKTLFLKSESHKLFNEFEVTTGQSIKKGQPVILNAVGTVTPAGAAAAPSAVIGVSMHDGDAGELVTVMMKAYLITFAEAGTAALVAGPVKIHTTVYNAVTGYVEVDDASVTTADICGWALDAGGDGDVIRVAWL